MSVRLSLAPLHGVTIRVFRNAYFASFSGFDSAMAPFIPAVPDAERATPSHFKDVAPELNAGVSIVPQVMANDPAAFASTANVLAAMGYGEVNWNLGCPYPMVTGKKRGSGLLPHPGLVERFLDEACATARVPISVKLRLGLRDKSELFALIPALNRFPLARVIVHPRLASQMYGGEVDLDAFERAAGELRHDVCYNGDVRDARGFEALSARFPRVREWMIGRGALMDPFLPARIKGLAVPADPMPVLAAFHDRLFAAYRGYLHGPRHLLDKMKEVWGYLGAFFPRDQRAVKEIMKAKTQEAYRRSVLRLLPQAGQPDAAASSMALRTPS